MIRRPREGQNLTEYISEVLKSVTLKMPVSYRLCIRSSGAVKKLPRFK